MESKIYEKISFMNKTLSKIAFYFAIFIVMFSFSLPEGLIFAAADYRSDIKLFSAFESEEIPPVNTNPILDYSLDIQSRSALVIEAGRGMRLYLKNQDEILDMPIASKIMTAILAIENIAPATMVTISNVAARESDASLMSLRAGEKYTVEYLLHGMILSDNDAAAIALAEQVRGSEDDFVKLMNERTGTYLLENTIFKNSTGLYDEEQKTTVIDVSRLVRYALTLPRFSQIIQTKDVPFILSTAETKHVISNLENSWIFVSNMTGGMMSQSQGISSFFITARNSNMNIIVIGSISGTSTVISDLTTITESIFSDYEVTTLVRENQVFPATVTVGEDTFGIRFHSSITYIRPRDIDFIKSTTYEENPIIEYPILTSRPVARVTFELLDGTRITADLYPDRTIYGGTTWYNILLSTYNSNKQLAHFIIALSGIFVLLLVFKIIFWIYRFATKRN